MKDLYILINTCYWLLSLRNNNVICAMNWFALNLTLELLTKSDKSVSLSFLHVSAAAPGYGGDGE